MTLSSVFLILAIIFIVSGMLSAKQQEQCISSNTQACQASVQYVPTSIYQEQIYTPNLLITYDSIFNNSDIWERYPLSPTYYSSLN
jgi:hypothetical protein